MDLNHDKFVQANEIQPSGGNYANFLALTGNWNPANPGSPTTANTVDPNLKNDATDEFIVGLDREIGAGLRGGRQLHLAPVRELPVHRHARSGSRRTSRRRRSRRPNCPGNDGPGSAPGTARRSAVPVSNVPARSDLDADQLHVGPYNRAFNGFEVTGRKRMSNHWLMNTSFAYNSTIVNMNGWPGDSANGLSVAA